MEFKVTITRTIANFHPYEWEVATLDGDVVAFGQADSFGEAHIAIEHALRRQDMI